jgi:hypothetical protein
MAVTALTSAIQDLKSCILDVKARSVCAKEARVNIGWVGGVESSNSVLIHAAARAGHTLEVHTGDVRGRGADGLAALVERSDVVIIVLDVNSHGAVLKAREVARKSGRRVAMVRRPSVSALNRVIREQEALAHVA